MPDSLRPHEPQHTGPPYPSLTPRVHPNPCPLCRWCHPSIPSSVVPFSSCPQYFAASGSFQMSQLFASGGQSTGVSASTSVLPMNTQDWSNECINIVWIVISINPLRLYIFLLFKAIPSCSMTTTNWGVCLWLPHNQRSTWHLCSNGSQVTEAHISQVKQFH